MLPLGGAVGIVDECFSDLTHTHTHTHTYTHTSSKHFFWFSLHLRYFIEKSNKSVFQRNKKLFLIQNSKKLEKTIYKVLIFWFTTFRTMKLDQTNNLRDGSVWFILNKQTKRSNLNVCLLQLLNMRSFRPTSAPHRSSVFSKKENKVTFPPGCFSSDQNLRI